MLVLITSIQLLMQNRMAEMELPEDKKVSIINILEGIRDSSSLYLE